MKGDLGIVGSTEYVEIAGIKNIPAKIDTGADSSAIWASGVDVREDGTLVFKLFGKKSPLYTGEELKTRDYKVGSVRSSHGDSQIRYRVKLPLTIAGRTIRATFTLANRSRNNFPVLIGRRGLTGKFVVDVSKSAVEQKKKVKSMRLTKELKDNPFEFHQKYIRKEEKI